MFDSKHDMFETPPSAVRAVALPRRWRDRHVGEREKTEASMASERSATKTVEKPKFLAQVRQAAIVSELGRAGSVTVSELAQQLSVSEMTVRARLVELGKGWQADPHPWRRGQAGPGAGHGAQRQFRRRGTGFRRALARNAALKRRIAATAAELAAGARSIALDVGTTTYFVAESADARRRQSSSPTASAAPANSPPAGLRTYLAGRPDPCGGKCRPADPRLSASSKRSGSTSLSSVSPA